MVKHKSNPYYEEDLRTPIDKLWMSDKEICKRYTEGKSKGEMIFVLGQLNLCKRATIMEVLIRNGITPDTSEAEWKRKTGRKKKYTAEEQRKKKLADNRKRYQERKNRSGEKEVLSV